MSATDNSSTGGAPRYPYTDRNMRRYRLARAWAEEGEPATHTTKDWRHYNLVKVYEK